MNDNEKLISINEELKDFITNINWEDRMFLASLSIFETLIKNSFITDTTSSPAFVGEVANSAISAAKIFIDKYKNNLND